MARVYDDREEKKESDSVGDEYEDQVARLYADRGYSVHKYGTGLTVDIQADNGEEILCIQCKNWVDPVRIDADEIRKLARYVEREKAEHRRRAKGMIAYSHEISSETQSCADKYDIDTKHIPYKPSIGTRLRWMNKDARKQMQYGLDGIEEKKKDVEKGFWGKFGNKSPKRK